MNGDRHPLAAGGGFGQPVGEPPRRLLQARRVGQVAGEHDRISDGAGLGNAGAESVDGVSGRVGKRDATQFPPCGGL
jgi:hypothetical protein